MGYFGLRLPLLILTGALLPLQSLFGGLELATNKRREKMERISRNLYKKDGKLFRLFGKSVVNHWILAPVFKELVDINIATGKDIYGKEEIALSVTGGVSHCEHIQY